MPAFGRAIKDKNSPPKDNFSSEALVDLHKQDKDGDQ
jgi:hypothetical protein